MARKKTDTIKYSKFLAKRIAREIASGKNLQQILEESKDSGEFWCPSYNTILTWKRKKQEFKIVLDQAYIDRADYYSERLFGILQKIENGDLNPAQGKVLVDAYHRLLEKVHPLYAKKQVNVTTEGGGVQFNITMAETKALPVPSTEGEIIEDD